MTTIRHLAQLAGVSTATVVRALRNSPHIKPETRDKVLELATLYTYHPRPLTGQDTATNLIGCVVPRVSSAIFSQVVQGVLEQAFMESLQAIVLETENNVRHTGIALDVLREHRVQGILLAPGHVDLLPNTQLMMLWSQGIHLVALDDVPFEKSVEVDCVETDFLQLARLSVEYLHHLGHRHIAYIGHVDRGKGITTARGQCFREVMHDWKLSTRWFYDANTYSEHLETLADMLLADSEPPTAMLVWSDMVAARLINIFTQRGWPVPRKMSILSAGNLPLCDIFTPRITSIEQSFIDMGKRGAELLFQRINSGLPPGAYAKERIHVPARLVVRESCGRPRPG